MIHCSACDQDKDDNCFYSVETRVGNNIINSHLYKAACKDCISEDEIALVGQLKKPDIRIAAGYNTKIRKEISNKGWISEWNAVQKLFYKDYRDVKALSDAYKESADQFRSKIRFYISLGFLKPQSFITSLSKKLKLSNAFKEEAFYSVGELNTLIALMKDNKFKKRDDRIYSKLEEYDIHQDTNNKNLFKLPSGVEYILQPRDKTLDRTCSSCLYVRSSELFTRKDKDAYQCLYCTQKISRERYQNKDEEYKIEFRKQGKRWRKDNPDKVREHRRGRRRSYRFTASKRLPLHKTSTWLSEEYLPQFFYDHPSGVKMINAGIAGKRVEGGVGNGYKTKMVFDKELGSRRENPIYDESGRLVLQTHWQIDHSIPLSIINKVCEEFNFDVKQVYANHYLNLRPMWQEENLDKLDTIATYLLEDESQLNNLIKEIFINVIQESELFKIINYFKKISLRQGAQLNLFGS